MKHVAAVVVDKALGRRTVGENHLVPGELDVEIFDLFDFLGLDDARAVDQEPRRNQRAVDVERVLGRDPQIARRHPVGDRPGGDPDRQNLAVACDKAGVIGATTDPLNRPRLARQRHNLSADREVLDGHLSPIG